MSKFWCRYCGNEEDFSDRDYDMGLFLAEAASFEALGHTDYVTPYLICKACADDVRREIKEGRRNEG